MNHATPEQIIAYVEFVRAVERLLAEADAVKERHKELTLTATGPRGGTEAKQ